MSLELLIGPMWASKSTELIKRIKLYKVINKKLLVINHTLDKRYKKNKTDPVEYICTHDNVPYPAIMCDNLETILPLIKKENYEIVLIDEAQFFDDLYKIVNILVDKLHKTVIVAGLSGDINKVPIGQILLLIPNADIITQLSALCIKCSDGTLAHFTKKKVKSVEFIGGKELYEPVCRKHHC